MQMRGDYNTLVGDARKADIVSKSQMMQDEALENLFRTKSGDSLNEAFQSLARSYGPDGRTPVGNARAKAMLFEELADTGKYSDEDVKRILGEAITDQGTSWADRFGRDLEDLMDKRADDTQREFSRTEAAEQRANKTAEKELLNWVQSEWNGDEETLTQIIKEAKTKGISTERLQAHLAYSTQQKNEDFWNKDFEERYEQGLLTLEDVD